MAEDEHGTPIQPSAFSSFLGYMHRRLSDIVSPDTSLDEPPTRFGLAVPSTRGGSEPADPHPAYLTESPSLHRAGLLIPRSYNVSPSVTQPGPPVASPHSNTHSSTTPHPHTPNSIRADTVELSNMSMSFSTPVSIKGTTSTSIANTKTFQMNAASGVHSPALLARPDVNIPASSREPPVPEEEPITTPNDPSTFIPPGRMSTTTTTPSTDRSDSAPLSTISTNIIDDTDHDGGFIFPSVHPSQSPPALLSHIALPPTTTTTATSTYFDIGPSGPGLSSKNNDNNTKEPDSATTSGSIPQSLASSIFLPDMTSSGHLSGEDTGSVRRLGASITPTTTATRSMDSSVETLPSDVGSRSASASEASVRRAARRGMGMTPISVVNAPAISSAGNETRRRSPSYSPSPSPPSPVIPPLLSTATTTTTTHDTDNFNKPPVISPSPSTLTAATTAQQQHQTPRLSALSLLRPAGASSRDVSPVSPNPRRRPLATGNEEYIPGHHRTATMATATAATSPTETPMATPRPPPRKVLLSSSMIGQGGYEEPDEEGRANDASERTPLLVSDSTSGVAHRHQVSAMGREDYGAVQSPRSITSNVNGALFASDHDLDLEGGIGRLHGSDSGNFKSSNKHGLPGFGMNMGTLTKKLRKEAEMVPMYCKMGVKALPAVMLGCLLNILDGVSYGMIIFPATGVFAGLGGMGVSMFFVSAVVAQLVYTFGGSGFAGGNGSMMIEVVPFFHILATSISAQVGEDMPKAVIATTLVAYTLSSILTGLSFLLLGALKLGVIVGFFPRHILVGCIGGVGVFLIETGLTVSTRISEDDFSFSWETFQFMVLNGDNFILWTIPLFLATLLRLITHKFHHQLIFPLYFVIIPVLFYVIVTFLKLDLDQLRHAGWLFDMGTSGDEPWWTFYTYFSWKLIHWNAIWATLPTQFALLFFNILHPPLNVPALAVSLDADVDTNKELVAHGYSNLLAGAVGTVPNYLVYVNTLLFYRVGGDNRIASFLLAVATAVLLVIGSGPIAYIPVMVVGALIFVLGFDLVKEALWDTRHRVTWSEYVTILSIMVCMTAWDFVIGVLFGIVISCFFFVIQNSRRKSIRAMFTGDNAISAVRRPSMQRAYIREVSQQTMVLRLQGFLFFGTITTVEETIRTLVDGPSYQNNPIRFLVLDLSLVAGVDMSAAEAFVRIQRLLSARSITLVFCGFNTDSSIHGALRSVNVLGSSGVELFSGFNEAMEWTENAYLRAWFRSQKFEAPPPSLVVPGRQDARIEQDHSFSSFVRSPRRSQLRDVGSRTIATELHHYAAAINPSAEPLNTIVKALSSHGHIDLNLFAPIESYLERISLPAGQVLWSQGQSSDDGLYIIESGALRASYHFSNFAQVFEESMVPGTVAGELSALSNSPRNCTVTVEHPATLWRLNNDNLRRLQKEKPELAASFIQLVLKAAKADYDILLAAIACKQ